MSTPGELVGWDDGDGAVQIRIVEVMQDGTITADVVKLGHFFSAQRLTGGRGNSEGFILGERLILGKTSPTSWTINKPENRPWHTLGIHKGKKVFEHYR
jgi:hypothetical protein